MKYIKQFEGFDSEEGLTIEQISFSRKVMIKKFREE